MEYSAGMVKLSFWFSEFRKVVSLLNSGKTLTEIKALNLQENIFSAPTQARAIQIFCTVSRRVKGLNQSFYQLFEHSDLSTQKLIALIAIMKTDSDIRIFFKDKQLQSEKVAKWKDYTLKRLGTCYKTMLMEAGVTDRAPGNRKILKPILDNALKECLRTNGMELTIHALTGVR